MIDVDAREVLAHQPFDAKENGEIQGVAWARDDRPVLCLADGSVRTMDGWLQVSASWLTLFLSCIAIYSSI